MIGQLEIDGHIATLEDDGRWTVPTSPSAEASLNRTFPVEPYSPSHGWYGHRAFELAAARVPQAIVVSAPADEPEDAEEVVY